jgi:hypothetical protein
MDTMFDSDCGMFEPEVMQPTSICDALGPNP